MFPTARRVVWPFIEERLKLKYDWKMLRMVESAKMVNNTVVVYLRTSRAEPIHGRAAILQSWQRLGSQQCTNLHNFCAPLTIGSRKCCNTVQPSRSFNSAADYARLGLPAMASRAEIKSAYFSLAKKLHPDNGGDASQFNEVICWFITNDISLL